MLSVEATLTYDSSPQEVREARLASEPLSIKNRSLLTVLTFMVLLFQHPAGLGHAPHVRGWRALRQHFITGKTRYASNASLGRCHGAGVRLSRPFLGKPKSAIRQTIYRLYPSPSNRTLIKLIPRTVQRALINLAIEDVIAAEESSCKKCLP